MALVPSWVPSSGRNRWRTRRLAAVQVEIRRRYAGTRERDSEGRLYDREGFTDVKTYLGYAQGQQRLGHEETDQYAQSRADLDRRA